VPHKLFLTLGGICLFVYRQKQQDGLVALMPRDLMHGHWPQIIRNENAPPEGYLAGTFDWRKTLTGGNTPTTLSQAAHFTNLTGSGFVPPRMFDEMTKPDAVRARFFLPWPQQVNWSSEKPVKIETVHGKQNTDPVSGDVELVYEFSQDFSIPMYDEQSQPKPAFPIVANGDKKVVIANVMSPKVNRGFYGRRSLIPHATLFYDVLDGCGDFNAPSLRTAEDYDNSGKPFGALYVNPVECIIGTGCEEGIRCE
jgi:hypothetical protein